MFLTDMKAAFHTLGCRVNSYETQAIKEQFFALGFEEAAFDEAADVYVVNTCSVTQVAERKSRQMLHRARKLSPDAVIAATGCYVQETAESLIQDGTVDIIAGNNEKSTLAFTVQKYLEAARAAHQKAAETDRKSPEEKRKEKLCTSREERTSKEVQEPPGSSSVTAAETKKRDAKAGREAAMPDLTRCREYEEQKISSAGGHVRAYIKIQDGCDRFCSYCIIPYLRGRSRSRRSGDIISEAAALAKNGYKEIIITGIDISDFKADAFEKGAQSLLFIIEEISKICGIKRIRLGSLECSVITAPFLSGLSRVPSFCAQFHLSLQSGSDGVLKRMNRRYTSKEYLEKVQLIRNYFPEAAITTDIIAGFPAESEAEFEETCAFVKKVNFSRAHVFRYSKRKGTKAAAMQGQLAGDIKARRCEKLIRITDTLRHEYEAGFIGKSAPVLFEEKTPDGFQVGFTPEYVKVAVRADENLVNSIENVSVKGFVNTQEGEMLFAKL